MGKRTTVCPPHVYLVARNVIQTVLLETWNDIRLHTPQSKRKHLAIHFMFVLESPTQSNKLWPEAMVYNPWRQLPRPFYRAGVFRLNVIVFEISWANEYSQ